MSSSPPARGLFTEMNKEQKAALVEELAGDLKDADALFAIDYRGLSVPQAAELRATLRDAGTRFRIVKNRLTLRAADEAGIEEIKEHLEGPTAIAFVGGDTALAAKAIFRLGREWEVLSYKGGLMDGEPLDEDSFTQIARLPGRDQMDAQLAGIVASPLTGLVRGLGSMVQGLASQLQQISEQGLVGGGAAPAPAPDSSASGTTTDSMETATAGPAEEPGPEPAPDSETEPGSDEQADPGQADEDKTEPEAEAEGEEDKEE